MAEAPDTSAVKDLFSLAIGPTSIADYLEQLSLCVELPEIQGPETLPLRSGQIAGLMLNEVVGLVRLGSRNDVAEASVQLSRFMADERSAGLARVDPEAHRLVSAASVTLTAAAPAASAGGEAMVLRSWGGKAAAVLRCLLDAPDQCLRVDELLRGSAIEEKKAVGMLADLESASLLIRYRDDRDVVIVSAGIRAHEPHVRALLREAPAKSSSP